MKDTSPYLNMKFLLSVLIDRMLTKTTEVTLMINIYTLL